jgi:hypothetical protein
MTETQTPTAPDTADPTALTTVVDAYIASLNELDADARAELVAQAWTEDARCADPFQDVQGHAALAQIAPNVQGLYPGAQFRRTTGVDAHHEFARFAWEMVGAGGDVLLHGMDVIIVAPDGRIGGLAGFFGDFPAA